MANPNVQITVGSVDPNANPITVNDLFALLQTVLHGEITGSYTPYVIGSDAPGINQRDFAWIELDSQARPIALKTFYNGQWRRVYNGMIGEIRGYTGAPSTDFETSGKGKIGEQYDGWYLCNGQNGTPNLSDKFLLGAHMDNSAGVNGYSNGWQASIAGPDGTIAQFKSGGQFTESINPNQLPQLHVAAQSISIDIAGNEYKAATPHGPDNAQVIVDQNYANLQTHVEHIQTINIPEIQYGAQPDATPPVPKVKMWTLPPFIALGWIIFKGYT